MRNFLAGVRAGMEEFGQVLAWLVNTVLLSIVYVVAVGPVALLMRRKPLFQRKPDPQATTYWQARTPSDIQASAYRQF